MTRHADWFGESVIQQQLAAACELVAAAAGERFIGKIQYRFEHPNSEQAIESPLEAIFAIWYDALVAAEGDSYGASDFRCCSQQEVSAGDERFRIDFAILPTTRNFRRWQELGDYDLQLIAVEVDGHAFHEKTREQVAYRNHRDRLLQQSGWMVFHYSWSELTSDPARCVREVLGFASDTYSAFDHAYFKRKWDAERKSVGHQPRENDGENPQSQA